MENKKTKISTAGILFVILVIFAGWLLDVMSTYLGLAAGGTELSSVFLSFPSAWMLLLYCLTGFIHKFNSAPVIIRQICLLWIIILSLAPSVRNTILLLEVIV